MKIQWKTCFRLVISAFILYLCIHYWGPFTRLLGAVLGAASPIFVGLGIAYVLNILMSFYENLYFPGHKDGRIVRRTRRPVCMAAAFLTLCGILTLIIWLVVPELVSCLMFLASEIPPALERLFQSEFFVKVLPDALYDQLNGINWESYISSAIQLVMSGIGSAANTIFAALTSVFSVIVTAFISIIFSIYLLMGKDRLQGQCLRVLHHYLSPGLESRLLYLLDVLNDSFHRYIVGQCMEAVILGVLCIAGMLLFRLPYAAMIGTLVGFTALIPVVGAYIGAIVGAIMIATVSPLKALIFLIFLVVLQQLEGNLIYPKVVGKSLGLPAIWVLAAVTIGGSLMGISGMLLGVPITSALYRLFRENLHKREAKEREA